jgi:hypothetical protein
MKKAQGSRQKAESRGQGTEGARQKAVSTLLMIAGAQLGMVGWQVSAQRQ